MDLRFFCRRRRLHPKAFIPLIWLMVAVAGLNATDWRARSLGDLVAKEPIIVVVKMTAAGETLKIEIEESLNGPVPKNLRAGGHVRTYENAGKKWQTAWIGQASIELETLAESPRHILFGYETEGVLDPWHPHCLQPIAQKQRIVELLAMKENPAPYVLQPKYAGDVDLIYLIGHRFTAMRVTSAELPQLNDYFKPGTPIDEQVPWQHIQFSVHFSFDASRKPMLKMAPLDAQGVLPDLLRKADDWHALERDIERFKDILPAKFSITVDTTGPKSIGDLSFSDALSFLRAQLGSDRVEVIKASFTALAQMLDSDSVPAAIAMLRSPNIDFRTEAANFLALAKDPRSVEPLCMALDELPDYTKEEAHWQGVGKLAKALGEALRNLADPKTVPALKRAVLKGRTGGWAPTTLRQLGDETAFEPLLSSHCTETLETMVKRSNLPLEPWMTKDISYERRSVEAPLNAAKWLEWWERHKGEFRIIRSWEELQRATPR